MTKIMGQGSRTGMEIAVIGYSGRFPGASGIDEFWDNLKNGKESISYFSHQELLEAGTAPERLENPYYVKAKGVLPDIEDFDAAFFEYTAREAEIMDPQLRALHESSWEALEHAGYDPWSYNGLIGFYAGAAHNYHWLSRFQSKGNRFTETQRFEIATLNSNSSFCTRISYKLDLKGPGVFVQTACSTSLVAVHLACQALLAGECDLALAGGVSVSIPKKSGYLYQEGMLFSLEGHLRAFDAKADGIVFGNGVGIVVLKPLEEAIADGDTINALVKGSAVNNDGSRKVGFTAPGTRGQAAVIRSALRAAEVEPESIGYIEAHGTGTTLGDPIEIQALKETFDINKKGFCAIGSVKSNVGHLDTAAGVAGFIKTVLALKHKKIPPSINFNIPNPKIDFINSPFYINPRLTEWENGNYPLRAGVSSFGIGGTNAHIILEEAPSDTRQSQRLKSPGYRLILLSAGTGTALEQTAHNLAEYLDTHPEVNLAHVAYTLQVGRSSLKYRWMAVCSNTAETIKALTSIDAGDYHALSTGENDSPGVNPGIEPVGRDIKHLLTQMGHLWLQGQKIDWNEFYSQNKQERCRIPLPTYPFERRRYWIEEDTINTYAGMVTNWFYLPSWKPTVLPMALPGENSPPPGSCWLMFIDESGFSSQLVKQLEQEGEAVFSVKIGTMFKKVDAGTYFINPQKPEGYDRLLEDLQTIGRVPDKIVHFWAITGPCEHEPALEFERVVREQERGLDSLSHLARRIGKPGDWNNHRFQINVVSNNLHKLPGDEKLCPGKAPILAAVKWLYRECPNIRCGSIDISLPPQGSWQEARLVRQLSEELKQDILHPVIAFRGHERLVQSFEPIRLPQPPIGKIPSRLKKGGIYLVTGGLAGVGYEMAKYLAVTLGPKLVLIDNPVFPTGNKREHRGKLVVESRIKTNIKELSSGLTGAEEKFKKEPGIEGVDIYHSVEESLKTPSTSKWEKPAVSKI